MPSKPSHTVLPLYSAGSLNSVLYHHDCRNGLAGGIWIFEKSSKIGYVVPGIARRFIPVYGSGYTLSSTSALKTVEGNVAGYHPRVEKPTVEIAAPSAFASPED